MSTDPAEPIRQPSGSRTPQATEARRRRAVVAAVTAALVVGIGVGWIGRGALDAPHAAAIDTGRAAVPAPSPAPLRAAEADAEAVAAARFWSGLAWSLANENHDMRELVETLAGEDGDPRDAVDRAIAASSDRELATILSAITRIDESELLAGGDLRPFASRLVDVALDGLDGPSAEPPPDRRVYFSSTTADFDPATTAQTAFPTDQARIFAVIALDRLDADRVMVKWRHLETRRIHSLQSMPHRSGRPLWSYLSRGDDWDPGHYEVSFYSHDATMRLLGRGEFEVVAAGETDEAGEST